VKVEGEIGHHPHLLGIAAVGVPTGPPESGAEVFPTAAAAVAGAAGGADTLGIEALFDLFGGVEDNAP
jgi:hypothetical protein